MFQAKKNIWETLEGAGSRHLRGTKIKQRVSPSEIANIKPKQVGRVVATIK